MIEVASVEDLVEIADIIVSAAMHLAVRALVEAEGVDQFLVDEWNLSQPGMVERSDQIAAGVSPKAWRLTGEMEQLSNSFSAAGSSRGACPHEHTCPREIRCR